MAFIGNTNTTQAFTPAVDYFSGNGSTTAFTLSRPVASVAQVQVTIDNVAQNPSSAYTVSSNTITFTSAPSSGTNNIYVYYTSPITDVIAPGQSTVGLTQFSATGTPSASTYLRGDNSWAALSGVVTSNVAGTGVSVSGATGAVTISIGQAVATSSNVQFNSLGVGTAGSATAGEIRATNNITAYYSDIRLKTKVGDITNSLDKVRQIETMLYHANETAVELGYDASIIEVGLSAQSVQAVQPEAVAPAPIDDKYLTVRYERLVPLLIEAIKELEAKVAKLEDK